MSSYSESAFDLPVTEKLQTYKVKSYSLIADSDQYVTIPEFSQLETVSLLLFLLFAVETAITKLKPLNKC
jgi:hypothetical protein